MLRRLPAPRFIHHVIALLRDGKWLKCPCCGRGFGSHQIVKPIKGPARLYNRISYMCPTCVAAHDGNLIVITPPRPCSCPECGHIETSLVAMGRHLTRRHSRQELSF